jgi:hypothetical protein
LPRYFLDSGISLYDLFDEELYTGRYYKLAREWIVALINRNHDSVFSNVINSAVIFAEDYIKTSRSSSQDTKSQYIAVDRVIQLLSDFNNGLNIDTYPDHPKSCTINPAVTIDADYDSERAKDKLYFNLMIDSVFRKQLASVSGKGRYAETIYLDSYAGEYVEIVARFNSDWVSMGKTIRLNSVSFSA